jgi:hydroxymethylpyrimidine pyrophosphatase-like HAD family hydrolase
MKKTIFCDIDGTIFKYRKFETFKSTPAEMTDGALKKLKQWQSDGHMIVLTTARPERMRSHTAKELSENDVPWHRLIMGIGFGSRHLINDTVPSKNTDRAIAHNLSRDQGFEGIEI